MTRKRIIWICIIIFFLVLGLFLGVEERHCYCSTCFSEKTTHRLQFGWGFDSIPLSGEWSEETPSPVYDDFFSTAHQHTWIKSSGRSGGFFCVIWDGEKPGTNRFRYLYYDSDFRAFIQERISDGRLSKDDVIQIFQLQDIPEAKKAKTSQEKLAAELIEEYEK